MTRRILGWRQAGVGVLWLFSALIGLGWVDAGSSKFRNFDGWWYWFTQFGFPGWFSPVIGGLEIAGGVLLVVPSLASYSAVMLVGIMVVAWYSVLTTAHTAMSATDPVVHTVILVVLGAGWWTRRWRPRFGAGARVE